MTTYSDSKRVIERIGDAGESKDTQQWAAESNQPPKRTVIRWERFLHVRSIKVLLVENDDSTRHLVTALLRNSNYEVIQAANGLQAWKILEDVNNHVDLVLTEVVMPCLSGIGLLCKIMNHDLRKNIPVIMMSCHDSMALVFNCLSKGAVDFLVKPIRKNELKNLWQHIWRRCHSSSGSESGSSNRNEEDSGTQTSSTKQAIEVVSSPAVCADNTCTLVIQPNYKVQLDHANKGKELVARKRRKLESMSNSQVSGPVKIMGSKQNLLPELEFTANSKRLDKTPAHQSVEYPSSGYKAVITDPQMSSKTTQNDDSKEPVCIELSLKKFTEDADNIVQSNCNLLTSSEISAFSRYKSTPLSGTNNPNVITCNSSQPANNTILLRKEHARSIRPNNSNANILQSSSNGTSKNTDPLLLASESTRNDFSGSHDKELIIQYIRHHHHVHHYNDNDCLLNKLAAVESPHCESEHEYHIVNRRCSTAANAGGTTVQSNACLEAKDECGGETALTKFCQKRKEACLQNKVQYQNRERLSVEQSRVKLVSQKGRQSSNSATDE